MKKDSFIAFDHQIIIGLTFRMPTNFPEEPLINLMLIFVHTGKGLVRWYNSLVEVAVK